MLLTECLTDSSRSLGRHRGAARFAPREARACRAPRGAATAIRL